jgi:hypothetical protein
MVAGQSGRSGAVKNANPGDDNAYMGRFMFDWGQALHAEVSYGVSKSAGGIDTADHAVGKTGGKDYHVLNAGIDSHFDRSNVKAEYFNVQNIRGVAGWNMNTLALTATYYLTDTLEVAAKDIRGTSHHPTAGKGKAANTFVGLNYYINPKNNKMNRKARKGRNRHRIQLNYVFAVVDDDFKDAGALFNENTVLLQYQFKF